MSLSGPIRVFEGFGTFLTARAGIGIYPNDMVNGKIDWGLMPPEGVHEHRLLDLPKLPMSQNDAAFLNGTRMPDFGTEKLIGPHMSQQGINDFHSERGFVQENIDAAVSYAAGFKTSDEYVASAQEWSTEAERLTQGMRLSSPAPSPDEFAPRARIVEPTRETWISVARAKIRAATLFSMADGDDSSMNSATYFMRASDILLRQGMFSAAGLVAGAASSILKTLGWVNRETMNEAAVKVATSFSRSLTTDPDEMTYGLRMFLGISEGWNASTAEDAVLKMLFRSYRYNVQHAQPKSAADDLMRVAWIKLVHRVPSDSGRWGLGNTLAWKEAADVVKAAALMYQHLGKDESFVESVQEQAGFIYEIIRP